MEKLAKELDHGCYYDKDKGALIMPSDLTFEKGSDVVRPEAKATLQEFAKIMQRPTAANLKVYVAGHTDDLPILRGETKRRIRTTGTSRCIARSQSRKL